MYVGCPIVDYQKLYFIQNYNTAKGVKEVKSSATSAIQRCFKAKRTGITPDTWEEDALQKVKWRGLLKKASAAIEDHRQQE